MSDSRVGDRYFDFLSDRAMLSNIASPIQVYSVFANREYRTAYNRDVIDSADMYVLLKIASLKGRSDWTQGFLAAEIGVSPSTVNRALRRAANAKLYHPASKKMNLRSLEEALVHGSRYFLAPERGGESRGTLTAWAAPPLDAEIASSDSLPPVWPHPLGETRGVSVEPLHPSAPKVALRDPDFYAVLALVDALRLGDNRERDLAGKELHRIFSLRCED